MCDEVEKDQEEQKESPEFTEETATSKSSLSTSNTDQEIEAYERKLLRTEGKRPKTSIKLPEQLDVNSESEPVGDDFTRKNEQDIICECQPNVTGAAIPTISPVNSQASDSFRASNENVCKQYGPTDDLEEMDSSGHDPSDIASTSKANSDHKTPKKPSMIPKLTLRPNSSNKPVRDRGQTDLLKKPSRYPQPKKLENILPKDKTNHSKTEGKHIGGHPEDRSTSKISSRMFNLQERLKATTSMLRQRFEDGKHKADSSCQINSACSLAKKESIGSQTSEEESSRSISVMEELHKVIIQLKDTAKSLSGTNVCKKQKSYIEKILLKITEIQKIADKISTYETTESGNGELKGKTNKETKSKDNKIYIKFVPKMKDKNIGTNKKVQDVPKDKTGGVKTEIALGSNLTSESLNSGSNIPDEVSQLETNLNDKDSMDGIFIPSCEPPINIEEEDEETNGLDITITFPEINNLLAQKDNSHLSVRLSDISEEALKQLKRCPKDFTLRMDFIQGKILFQTGKAPVNNFSIGPDLKFVENPVDEKKSDIISIKPSTECSFASQLIPVENITKEITSYKSLRSADSELFSVVNLPFIYRNPSLNTVTKSCITFKNDGIISMALLARHFGRSMPQIPSLTNIFEEKMMENLNKATALQIQDRRRKNRANQRKGITTPNNV